MFLVYHFGQYWSRDLTIFDQLFLNIFLYQKKPVKMTGFYLLFMNLSSMHHPLKELRGRHVVSIQFFVLE